MAQLEIIDPSGTKVFETMLEEMRGVGPAQGKMYAAEYKPEEDGMYLSQVIVRLEGLTRTRGRSQTRTRTRALSNAHARAHGRR